MIRVLLLLTLTPCLLGAGAVLATITASAQCDETQVRVTLTAIVNEGEIPPDWVGLVVQRYTICRPTDAVVVTPEPYPIPPPWVWQEHVFFDDLPLEDVYHHYQACGIDAEGGLHIVLSPAGHHEDVTCGSGETIIAHGELTWVPTYPPLNSFTPCGDTCPDLFPLGEWDLSALTEAELMAASGHWAVFYGEFHFDSMPGGSWFRVDRIEVTDNCGPVRIEPTTWGALKDRYR